MVPVDTESGRCLLALLGVSSQYTCVVQLAVLYTYHQRVLHLQQLSV